VLKGSIQQTILEQMVEGFGFASHLCRSCIIWKKYN
jgi:hypothetical protein